MKKLFILILCINLWGAERIVTLTPSINEIVYALGKGDEVVANTQYCNYPPETKKVQKVGGYATISLEKILKAKPTMVVAQNYDTRLLNNLKKLRVKTYIFKTDSVDSIKHTITSLGEIFDKKELASKLTKNIDDELKSLDSILNNKKILIVIHPSKNLSKNIYIAGNDLYFNDIIKASNNKNAFVSDSKLQPVVNLEKIIGMNPDVVILLGSFYVGKEKELEKVKNAWRKLPIKAAKNGFIYSITKDYAGIPSDRVVYFIRDFKKILEDVKNKKL